MDKIDDGGAAFPRPIGGVHTADGGISCSVPLRGMSLRDWFAGQALGGMVNGDTGIREAAMPGLADWSYKIADAMIAARKEEPDAV